MRNLENHPGIKVGGQNINNLRYADDTVLIPENKEDLQKILNIIEEESRKKGEKIMDGLATWLGPRKVSDILAAVKDTDLWRDMIANAYKQGT
ncbi:hypothetical protein PoB_007298400 [Plakobranchus ocellatus]|uniref:Reverse transcriptase domain-containing protein n=1 Tax=Plakobranchus ocellatus TaxID=259542 RepID=A0AAV4DQJ3_9GAST|nr:hypothetical protein PoB_007298400 [Plakobranchus ocellatus]